MKNKLKNTFFAAFGVIGVTLLLSLLASFGASGSARSRAARLSQAQDLRRRGGTALRNVLDLQLSLNDYLRTGDDNTRQHMGLALTDVKTGLSDAANIEPKDLQRNRLKTAASLLEQWVTSYAEPQVEAKRRILETRVGTLVDSTKGDKVFRDLRAMLEEYELKAADDVNEAAAATAAGFGRLNLLLLAGGALIAAAAVAVLFHLLRTVVRPIEGILAWFDALRTGKPFTLEIPDANEIGDVADAFTRLGEDLKHSRREFEELAMMPETSPHPILEVKSDGSVAYANPAARELAEKAGITPAELIPTEAAKQLPELAGKDALTRREKAVGETRYDFVFHSSAGRDLIFAVGFERATKKP